jgi:tetratricopeptide (TPR) repeat protein
MNPSHTPLNALLITATALALTERSRSRRSDERAIWLGDRLGHLHAQHPLDRRWRYRGQAYCLVEQGRLDDAETLYNKCLALDPSDTKAQAEIRYIKSKR